MNNDLSTPQAALYLGISVSYLRNMRNGQYPTDGPSYHTGKDAEFRITCYYKKDDLDAWRKNYVFKKDKVNKIKDYDRLKLENDKLKELLAKNGISL